MAPGGGDLEGALGDFLPLDLRKVRPALRRLRFRGCGRGQQRRSFQVGEQRQQVRRRDHVELAGPRGLAALRCRADQALVGGRRMDRREQDARRRCDAAVEAQLPDGDIMRERLGVGGADRRQQAQSDR
jgi:hypothetical protein